VLGGRQNRRRTRREVSVEPSHDATYLGTLPEAKVDFHSAVLVKRYKYIALVLSPQVRSEGQPQITFACHLHQNEAKKLARALMEVAEAPVKGDFVDQAWFGVEGIGLGGPPRKDQLVEFNPSLLRQRSEGQG